MSTSKGYGPGDHQTFRMYFDPTNDVMDHEERRDNAIADTYKELLLGDSSGDVTLIHTAFASAHSYPKGDDAILAIQDIAKNSKTPESDKIRAFLREYAENNHGAFDD